MITRPLGPFDQGMTQQSSNNERMEEYLLANCVTEKSGYSAQHYR